MTNKLALYFQNCPSLLIGSICAIAKHWYIYIYNLRREWSTIVYRLESLEYTVQL